MPSQKDLLHEIETHATALAQAAATAEECCKRYTAEIEQTLQECLAANQAEYDKTMDRIEQEHKQATAAVDQELMEIEQACGLWAASWDGPIWETFEPDLEAPVPYLTRLGNLLYLTPASVSETRASISEALGSKAPLSRPEVTPPPPTSHRRD